MLVKRSLVFAWSLLGTGCTLLTHFDESPCDLTAPASKQCLPGFVCLQSATSDGGVCVDIDGGVRDSGQKPTDAGSTDAGATTDAGVCEEWSFFVPRYGGWAFNATDNFTFAMATDQATPPANTVQLAVYWAGVSSPLPGQADLSATTNANCAFCAYFQPYDAGVFLGRTGTMTVWSAPTNNNDGGVFYGQISAGARFIEWDFQADGPVSGARCISLGQTTLNVSAKL